MPLTAGDGAAAERRLSLYRSMLKIRRVEERIQALYSQGDMRCPTHFSIGQEAVAAGVCRNLTRDDYVISAHRSHAHYIAKGGSVRDVQVLKGLPFGLDQAAVEAVKKWKFKPGTLNGQPVDVIFNLTVNFKLN